MEFKHFGLGASKAPFESPYPPLKLSQDEKKKLRQLAKTLVGVNIEGYEEFLYENSGQLPPNEWQFSRRDEQVETFLRRREKYELRGFGATKKFRRGCNTASTSTSSTQSDDLSSLDVADIRTVGTCDGTIEDAVYGAMGPTTETMRYKSAYVKDSIEDCHVLSIIDNVTEEEPLTSLSIRWRVTENPPVLRTFLKSYDHIYFEATGFTQLSNGEPVGFQLLHSIDFPSVTPPLPNYSRGQVAAIGLWRQKSPTVVEIHAHGVFALPFERARALFVPMVTMSQAKSVMNSFYAAQMKKLCWALRERRTQILSVPPEGAETAVCSICTKKRHLHKGDGCQLCGEHVCSLCRISHKVAALELDNKMHMYPVHVCPFCMTKVINSDPATTIRAEIAAGEYDRFP